MSTNERVSSIADQLAIDFGDISEDEAFELYDNHKGYQEDIGIQKAEFEAIDTDLARESWNNLNIYDNVNNKIVSELEKQYGFSPDELTVS